MLTVWPDRYPRGWKGGRPDTVYPSVTASQALAHVYQTDAHFVPYYVEGVQAIPRLTKRSLPLLRESGVSVRLAHVVADIDCPKGLDVAGWFAGELDKIKAAQMALGAAAAYRTRGGYRLLWTIDPVDPLTYEGLNARLRAALAQHGIEADPACSDWTRCYRLPFVVRDGEPQQYQAALDVGALRLSALPQAGDPGNPFANVPGQSVGKFELPKQIGEGERDSLLFRYACQLRNYGLTEGEIYEAVSKANADRCLPPLGDDQVQKISRSASTYDAQALRLGSDTEIARALLSDLELDAEPLTFDRGNMWRYDPARGIWAVCPDSELAKHLATYDGRPVLQGVDKKTLEPKSYPLRVGARMIRDVVTVCQHLRANGGFFDAAPRGVVCANGFVQLAGGALRLTQPSAAHRATFGSEWGYEPGAQPVRLLAALGEWFKHDADRADKIQLVREFIGACLMGIATDIGRGLVCLGEGANGKSTFISFVRSMFAPEHVTAIPPQEMDQEYRRAMLAGSRLNCVNELPEAEIMASEAVKSVLTGDEMLGRHIRKDPFQFHPRAGHIMAANELPGVRDLSRGFWRRWVVLGFNRSFTAEGVKPDRGIVQALRAERGAAVSWAIDAVPGLLARGDYLIPESSKRLIDDWQKGADQVSAFIDEACTIDESARTDSTAIYAAYRSWAAENGFGVLNHHKFGRRLKKIVPAQKSNGKNCYPIWAGKKSQATEKFF
jgi:P4 family phage/plasmid primase-like protien